MLYRKNKTDKPKGHQFRVCDWECSEDLHHHPPMRSSVYLLKIIENISLWPTYFLSVAKNRTQKYL